MLDVYQNSDGYGDANLQTPVSLCHEPSPGACKLTPLFMILKNKWAIIKNRALPTPDKLEDRLKEIKDFLYLNPTEVVFIFLEDYVSNPNKLNEAFINAGLEPYILKPTEWNTQEHRVQKNKAWPTFQHMIKNNKRLVIFSDHRSTDLIYNMWENVAENMYSVSDVDKDKLCKERGESGWRDSAQRQFLLLNFFPEAPIAHRPLTEAFDLVKNKEFIKAYDKVKTALEESKDLMDHNTINGPKLKQALTMCRTEGLDERYKGRNPNFIAVDMVHKGNPMQHVDKINKIVRDLSLENQITLGKSKKDGILAMRECMFSENPPAQCPAQIKKVKNKALSSMAKIILDTQENFKEQQRAQKQAKIKELEEQINKLKDVPAEILEGPLGFVYKVMSDMIESLIKQLSEEI